jgi:hypothetical protein
MIGSSKQSSRHSMNKIDHHCGFWRKKLTLINRLYLSIGSSTAHNVIVCQAENNHGLILTICDRRFFVLTKRRIDLDSPFEDVKKMTVRNGLYQGDMFRRKNEIEQKDLTMCRKYFELIYYVNGHIVSTFFYRADHDFEICTT